MQCIHKWGEMIPFSGRDTTQQTTPHLWWLNDDFFCMISWCWFDCWFDCFLFPPLCWLGPPRVTTMTLIPGWKALIWFWKVLIWTQIKHSFYILSLSANILLGLFIMICQWFAELLENTNKPEVKAFLCYSWSIWCFSFLFLGFFTEMISTPFVLGVESCWDESDQ